MKFSAANIFFIITGTLGLWACSNKKEDLATPALSEYFPLQPGKYITYRLDSSINTNFGADTTVHYYRVKDYVDAQITDGMNRPAYRIYRSQSDSAGSLAYQPTNTFMAIPVGKDWVELLENNLRFMKLRNPIVEGFEWKGNSFINASSSNYNPELNYLADWEYTYQNVGQPFTVRGVTYPETITVLQHDEVSPEGPFDPKYIKVYNYSVEVYAKGIGLIYKNINHREWQPPASGSPGHWADGSYRLVLQIVDHN